MKTILCFAVVIALAYSSPAVSDKQAQAECEAQTGVTDQIIANARQGHIENEAKLGEHLLCISRKEGLQGADGRIQRSALRAKLLEERPASVDAALEKCAVEQGSPEKTAFFVANCIYGVNHV